MCRSIKPLFNLDPPATDEEIEAAARQFVRKVSGYREPSQANQQAFHTAVADVQQAIETLLHSLETKAPPRNREVEAEKAKARSAKRFG
ncbi:MAG: DUF2277 domain-containing protein [Anaerolineales bacterium]|nr:DUF2277 domain-containing protein [Anaerolineales bacterium]